MRKVLKTLLLCVLGVAVTQGQSSTLICQSCVWPGNDDCFEEATANTWACPYKDMYCITSFSLQDGILTSVSRGCEYPASDFDETTDYMPSKPKCFSSKPSGGEAIESAACHYPCNNTNNCNNIRPRMLRLCENSCHHGSCDYITGKCACAVSFSGANCSEAPSPTPQTFLSCVQCSEEEDSGCRNAPTSQGTICGSASDAYCATSVTTTYDAGGFEVRSTVTRSCSSDYVASDECFITNSDNLYDGYLQYTCVSTCETDNCNTGIPDGVIENGESLQPAYCYQCTSTSDGSSCALASPSLLTRCPSNQRYCTSTAVYYLSDKVDTKYPAEPGYLFSSITRSCSETQVSPSCQETAVGGSSLRKYTCTETCTGDRCNDRWPARPKCANCASSSSSSSSSSDCFKNPGSPQPCFYPYQKYCFVVEKNKPKTATKNAVAMTGGYFTHTVTRGCSYHDYGTGCVDSLNGDGKLQDCNKTCTTDGCNLVNGARTPKIDSIFLTMTYMMTSLSIMPHLTALRG